MESDDLQRELAYYKRHLDALAAEKIRNEHRQWVLEIQLRRMQQGSRLLSRLARSAGAQSDFGTMFRITAFAINAELGMDRTAILVPAGSERRYRPAYFAGFARDAEERLAAMVFELSLEIESGPSLIVNRSTETTELISSIRAAFEITGFLCVPVMVDKGTIGLIVSGRLWEDATLSPPFDQVDADTFRAIAGMLEAAVQNTRLVLLEQTHRLRSELFANVSHEFRTPLTLTLGPLGQILAGRFGDLPTSIRDRLRMVERSQERLLGLINEILDLATLQAGAAKFRSTPIADINEIVRDCAGQFRAAAVTRGIELRLSLDPALAGADLVGDRKQLERLITNLLSNAIKFTHEGYVEVATRRHADALEIIVGDSGIGIAGEHLEHLFDRFYRVEEPNCIGPRGTGIGLALVREIAQLHGGQVGVGSEKGKGSRFTVTIPLGQTQFHDIQANSEQLGSDGPPSSREGKTPLQGPQFDLAATFEARAVLSASNRRSELEFDLTKPVVLHIEDDADLRAYVRDILADEHNVFAACDGNDGIERARRYLPDLILLDQMMPAMDGAQVLRTLRGDREFRSTPIIFLTAQLGTEGRIESLEAGADDYLTKPFHEAELRARVNNLIKARSYERQLSAVNVTLEKRVREQMVELLRSGELKRFLPPSVANNLLSGQLNRDMGPELRQVTVLVADLSSPMGVVANVPGDMVILTEMFNQYFAEVTALVAARGGTVESFASGRVSIIFGAPDTCEPEASAQSAVSVAFELRDRTATLAAAARRRGVHSALRSRIGICTGACMVGAFGDELRQTYTAIGPATTIAAALQERASLGSILCSQSTWKWIEQGVKARAVVSWPGDEEATARPYELLEMNGIVQVPTPQVQKTVPRRQFESEASRKVFRREGEYWTVAHAGSVFRLKDSKGLQYLGRLLSQPGAEIHVLDLAAGHGQDPDALCSRVDPTASGLRKVFAGDAGTILDNKAKAAYRARIRSLRVELEEAKRFADHARASQAQEEMTALVRELASAIGLGGRDRRAASASERARVNVVRTIKSAIERISKRSVDLGNHLGQSIQTGTFCMYRPSEGALDAWYVET